MLHRETELRRKPKTPQFYFDSNYLPFKRSSFFRFAHKEADAICHTADLVTSSTDKLGLIFELREVHREYEATFFSVRGLSAQFRKNNMLLKSPKGLSASQEESFSEQAKKISQTYS